MRDKYYDEIKNNLIDDETYSKVKDYSKEKHKVITYFEIGRLLNEAGGKYGDNIIEEYSKKLVIEVGKKYNRRTLFRMKQFYNMFKEEKVSPLATQLTWSYYSELLSIKDFNKLMYYINTTKNNNLSKRELREKIKNKEYERLSIETKNKLIVDDKVEVKDLVPNPILIRNNNNIEIASEKALHHLILEDIESFMKELGNHYSFIGSEYKIKMGDRNHYIDLLLFNIKYNCYVVIELKITGFKVEYISQVQKYMNYLDKNIKEVSNNNTMGILICKRENRFAIEYCWMIELLLENMNLCDIINYRSGNMFEQQINELENIELSDDYTILKGNVPILFSAPHTMYQLRDDGSVKLKEPYTKAIALYLNKYCNTYAIVKNNDTGIDSNRDNYDQYNVEMRRLIQENNIKLVIDLHGASKDREFDIEFGTLNNLSADFSTIKELEEAFTENGINNINHNNPFKGGAITQGIYALNDVNVIQIEINGKYRDYSDIKPLEKLIQSLKNFIKQYNEYINR